MNDLFRKYSSLTDKFMSIPKGLTPRNRNTSNLSQQEICTERHEIELNENIETLEKVVKQQAYMIAKLETELKDYETIKETCEIDNELCSLIENNLADVNLQDEEAIYNIATKVNEAVESNEE